MKRLGKFYMSREAIDGEGMPEVFSRLKFVPYHVTFLADMNNFSLIGTSPAFDELEVGIRAPTYTIVVQKGKNKDSGKVEITSVKAERQK